VGGGDGDMAGSWAGKAIFDVLVIVGKFFVNFLSTFCVRDKNLVLDADIPLFKARIPFYNLCSLNTSWTLSYSHNTYLWSFNTESLPLYLHR
jgi:hypothetical protein